MHVVGVEMSDPSDSHQPFPSTLMSNPTTAQIIDDTDSSLFYSSGWQTLANPNAFNSTLTFTTTANSKVRINFSVYAKNATLSIFGAIGPKTTGLDAPHSEYSLDGPRLEYFNATETDSFQYNQRFYLSPLLGPGNHSLTVVNLLASTVLYIDYFLITSVNNTLSTTTHVGTSTVPGSTQTASSSTNDSTSHRTTTIIASVLGSVIGILLLFIIFFWLRWWKKRKLKSPDISSFVAFPSIGNSQVLPNKPSLKFHPDNRPSESTSDGSGPPHASEFRRSPHGAPAQETETDPMSPPDYEPPTYIPSSPPNPSHQHGRLQPSKLRDEVNRENNAGNGSDNPQSHIL